MPLNTPINIADGQLAASAAAIFSTTTNAPASGTWNAGRYDVSLCNTSGSAPETVTLTMTRAGGTSRRIRRLVLAANEQAVVSNIPIGDGDVLFGVATDASTVDYMVSLAGENPLNTAYLSASGAAQQVNSGQSGNQTIGGRLTANLLAVGPAPTDTYAATMTLDVTKSLHVISASNGTSATVTYTPSAAGSAGDLLTIITEADGTGTVTATFASTFHSSGTQATTLSKFSSIVFESDGTRWVEICRTTALT